MWQSRGRGSPVPGEDKEEEKEVTSASSEWGMEEYSDITSEEEWEEEDEESPAYSPLSSPRPTAPTLSPEKAVVSTCKRPPPQLIPISELKSFPMSTGINNTSCTSITGSQQQPRTCRRGLLAKTHEVDQAKLPLGWFCVCSTQFSEQTYLTQHIKNFTKEPMFPCKWCPRKYTHLTRLRQHVVNSHHKNPFMAEARGCSDCGMIFKNREEHKAHRQTNHPHWTQKFKSIPHAVDEIIATTGRFRCVCGKEYAKEQYLIGHVQNYNNPVDFQGEICLSSFKNHGQLQRHHRDTHKMPAKDNDRFGCSLCAHLFQNMKELRQHMQREHDVIYRNQAAKHSEKLADSSQRSRVHGIAPQNPRGKYSARCLCGSRYPSKFQLLQHIQNFQVQVSFKCPHCQGEFNRHAHLASHVRKVHQVDYVAFGCKLCGAILPSKTHLVRHKYHAHWIGTGGRAN